MSWQPLNRFTGVIDVSHHNGVINWPRVAGSNVLVFIKATQGARDVDPNFRVNWAGASASGMLPVPYHFLTEEPTADQLRNLTQTTSVTGPVMVDWEVDPATGRRPRTVTMESFCSLLKASSGRNPLAYHGMYDLSSPLINNYPWMIPKYGPQPQGPKWLFWQSTDRAMIPGIVLPTDQSVFAGTEDELRAWYRDGTMPAGFDAPSAPQPVAPVSDVASAERNLQVALQLAGRYSGALDAKFGKDSLTALAGVDPVTAAALKRWNVP